MEKIVIRKRRIKAETLKAVILSSIFLIAFISLISAGIYSDCSIYGGSNCEGMTNRTSINNFLNYTINGTEVVHDDLTGLQGGSTNEYYHLNQSWYERVRDYIFNFITGADVPTYEEDNLAYNGTLIDEGRLNNGTYIVDNILNNGTYTGLDTTWLANWTAYNTTWSSTTNESYLLISNWNSTNESYVPYAGANSNVDLGIYNLTLANIFFPEGQSITYNDYSNLFTISEDTAISGSLSLAGTLFTDFIEFSTDDDLQYVGANNQWNFLLGGGEEFSINETTIDAYNNNFITTGNITGNFFGDWNGSVNYVPYAGANSNVDLGIYNLTSTGMGQFAWTDLLEQPTISTPPSDTLRLYVEDFKGFSFYKYIDDTGMVRQLARDNVFVVKNELGYQLDKMSVVYACGSSGNVPLVCLARADNLSTMPDIGILVEDIADGSFGRVMMVGLLENVNTNAFEEGDILYVSDTTAGELINIPPLTPNLTQEIGIVLVKGVGNGAMQVAIKSLAGNEFGTINNFTIAKNLEVLGDAKIDGNVSADYFLGDGSKLTNLPSGDNSSWNETYADTLYSGIEWDYNQTIPAETYTDEANNTLASWVDNLFVKISDIVSQVGNWSADKDSYLLISNWNSTNESYMTGSNFTIQNQSLNNYILYVNSTNGVGSSYDDSWINSTFNNTTEISEINDSVNNYISDVNTSVTNTFGLYTLISELVDKVGNWSLDKADYLLISDWNATNSSYALLTQLNNGTYIIDSVLNNGTYSAVDTDTFVANYSTFLSHISWATLINGTFFSEIWESLTNGTLATSEELYNGSYFNVPETDSLAYNGSLLWVSQWNATNESYMTGSNFTIQNQSLNNYILYVNSTNGVGSSYDDSWINSTLRKLDNNTFSELNLTPVLANQIVYGNGTELTSSSGFTYNGNYLDVHGSSYAGQRIFSVSGQDSFIIFNENSNDKFKIGYDQSEDIFKIAKTNFADNAFTINYTTGNVFIANDLETAGTITSDTRILSAQAAVTTSTDALDVSGVNSVGVNTGSGDVTIGGLSGGVKGQIVHIFKTSSAGNLIIEHNEASGTQKIITRIGKDISFLQYGGLTLSYNGAYWFVVDDTMDDFEVAGDLTCGSLVSDGKVEGTSFEFTSAKTYYYSISGNDFLPFNPDIQDIANYGCYIEGTSGSVSLGAPIHLPNGATITGGIIYGNDAGSAWYLYRSPLNANTQSLMASGAFNTENTTISNAVIDNSAYSYYFWSSIITGAGDYISGARITYTVSVL